MSEIPRSETCVVADAEAFRGVLLGRTFASVDVGGDGLGSDADVGEGEVVGDDAAPAVGTKLDDWMRHGWMLTLLKDSGTRFMHKAA